MASSSDNISNLEQSIHLTGQAERALKSTILELKTFSETIVSTAHLLLCILRNDNDPTTKLLNQLNINYDRVKKYPHFN